MDRWELGARRLARSAMALLVGVLAVGFVSTSSPAQEESYANFNQAGELLRPVGHRLWVFVGAEVTPDDMNGGKAGFPGFHNVYIDPASYGSYVATGKFPDGTVMVKELVSVGAKQAPSGHGYFEGDFTALAAAVKDSKRFKNEPGHWAYFNFGSSGAQTAKMNPTRACNACHQANAAQDWVFTQYYPVLRAITAQLKSR